MTIYDFVVKIISFIHKLCISFYYRLVRHTFKICPSTVKFEYLAFLHGAKYISIGEHSSVQRGCYLTAWDTYGSESFQPEIVIGENCNIGAYNHITAINRIEIGDGCLTGKWVTITDNSHGKTNDEVDISPSLRHLYSKGEVKVEKNVWIGDKATILPGVTIGEGAIIAANAVVTKDVVPYSVVAGNPAIIIRIIK